MGVGGGAKNRKQPKLQSIHSPVEWVNKWCIRTKESYSAAREWTADTCQRATLKGQSQSLHTVWFHLCDILER